MSITYVPTKEGFGSNYQRIICFYVVFESKNIKYLYSPFTKCEHNYTNDSKYLNTLEKIANLKDKLKLVNNSEVKTYNISSVFYMFESNIDYYCNSPGMNFIKNCFWENKDRNFFKNNKLNVAVHIRRSNTTDIKFHNGAGDRVVEDNYFLNIIDIIRNKYHTTNILFHIYSQGDIENFNLYKRNDTSLHINEDTYNTFVGMVAADILVISPSSFSYTAALISDGEIYYKPFWHRPRKSWIICK